MYWELSINSEDARIEGLSDCPTFYYSIFSFFRLHHTGMTTLLLMTPDAAHLLIAAMSRFPFRVVQAPGCMHFS